MPISIQKYIIPGSSFDYEPGRSGSFDQKFLVGGMDPTLQDDLARACFATDAATGFYIPLYQTPHPTVPGFYASRYHSEPFAENSRTQVMVTVTYRPPEMLPGGATLIEIIGNGGKQTLSRWPSGNQQGQAIIVGYSPNGASFQTPLAAPGSQSTPGYFYSFATVEVPSPNTILRFTRRENGSPLSKSKTYRRTINKSGWQGGGKGTWLCIGIDGRNIAQGGTLVAPNLYEVVYTFEYQPQGWTEYAVYKDALTGSVPQNINLLDGSNNGYQPINALGYSEFNSLGLLSAL